MTASPVLDGEPDRVAEQDEEEQVRAEPPPEPEPTGEPAAPGFVWYASVELAADDRFLLAVPKMSQGEDPLGTLGNLAATLAPATEHVGLAFDMWPVPPRRLSARRSRQIRQLSNDKGRLPKEWQHLEDSLSETHVAFRITIRAAAADKKRAQWLAEQAALVFNRFTDGTRQRLVTNPRRDRSRRRQRRLAERWETVPSGPAPRKSPYVAAGTFGTLLKPASNKDKCPGRVLRAPPPVGPVPPDMPTVVAGTPPTRDLIPWGMDPQRSGRVVCVAEPQTLFTWTGGGSGYGKTETTIARFLWMARAGHGCLFLDPHSDAVERIKRFLGPCADRVVELAFDNPSAPSAATWNLFDIPLVAEDPHRPYDTASPAEWKDQMNIAYRLIVDSYSQMMGWEQGTQTKSFPMFENAVGALMETVPWLPRDARPNLFSVIDMLNPDEDEFRELVVERITERRARAWWEQQYEEDSKGGGWQPAVRQLAAFGKNPLMKVVLGYPAAGIRIRDLIEDGKVVLVKVGGDTSQKLFLSALCLFDVAKSLSLRSQRPLDQRPSFHLFCDEVPSYGKIVSGELTASLNEYRKYGLRAHLISQYIDGLPQKLRESLAGNRTHLMTSRASKITANWFAEEVGGNVSRESIINLPKYTFVTEVKHGGSSRAPFDLGGFTPEMLFGEGASDEETARLNEQIAANSRTVPLIEGEAAVDRVYEAMMAGLRAAPPPAQVAAAAVGDGDDAEADGWLTSRAFMDAEHDFFAQVRDDLDEDVGSLRADP